MEKFITYFESSLNPTFHFNGVKLFSFLQLITPNSEGDKKQKDKKASLINLDEIYNPKL